MGLPEGSSAWPGSSACPADGSARAPRPALRTGRRHWPAAHARGSGGYSRPRSARPPATRRTGPHGSPTRRRSRCRTRPPRPRSRARSSDPAPPRSERIHRWSGRRSEPRPGRPRPGHNAAWRPGPTDWARAWVQRPKPRWARPCRRRPDVAASETPSSQGRPTGSRDRGRERRNRRSPQARARHRSGAPVPATGGSDRRN